MTAASTISLIGMPGVGKSTVGVLLAKRAGLTFTDTDLDIQVRAGATLQEILESEGHIALRALEEEVLLSVPLAKSIISTGGSVVYSKTVMARLLSAGPVVYLKADLETLEGRVAAAPMRGIASDGAMSFADIYAERTPLYEHYAQYTIDTAGETPEQIAEQVLGAVGD